MIGIETEFPRRYSEGDSFEKQPDSKQIEYLEDIIDGDIIGICDQPLTDSWCLVPMYKDDVRGKPNVWQVGFDGVNIIMLHGQVGGKLQVDKNLVILNQSGRSLRDQAILQAHSRYQKKFLNDGYRPSGTELPSDPAAMTAYSKWIAGKDLPLNLDYPVIVQAKVDGIRMLCKIDLSGEPHCRSRSNRTINTVPHFRDDLRLFFSYLPSGTHLDGEIYKHGLLYREIESRVSIQRKVLHKEYSELEYWIFDAILPDNSHQEKRYATILIAYASLYADGYSVPTLRLLNVFPAYSVSEIIRLKDQLTDLGFEGAIIRRLANGKFDAKTLKLTRYRSGQRSDGLIKYKNHQDDEALIVGVLESSGREIGSAIFQAKDRFGNIFKLKMATSIENRRYWFEHPEQVIGKQITYRYQPCEPGHPPRFPVGVGFRADL